MPPRTHRLILVGDSRKERSAAALTLHAPWLARRFDVVTRDTDGTADLSRVRADLAVIFGGDGSILSLARRLGGNPVPVLGVNTGRLGFLADVPLDAFRETLGRLLRRPLRTSDRMMIEVSIRGRDGATRSALALNDAVIARGSVSRMVHLALTVGDDPLTLVSGDGLILATPSGSTAHSLSAGGPIVHPEIEAILVTPVCPHALAIRPMVLPADRAVRIRLAKKNGDVMLTVDGQEVLPIEEGDSLTIRRAPKPFRLVESGSLSWNSALRDKMGFGGAFTDRLR